MLSELMFPLLTRQWLRFGGLCSSHWGSWVWGVISAVEPWTFRTTALVVSVSSQPVQSFPERPCSRLDAAITALPAPWCMLVIQQLTGLFSPTGTIWTQGRKGMLQISSLSDNTLLRGICLRAHNIKASKHRHAGALFFSFFSKHQSHG